MEDVEKQTSRTRKTHLLWSKRLYGEWKVQVTFSVKRELWKDLVFGTIRNGLNRWEDKGGVAPWNQENDGACLVR